MVYEPHPDSIFKITLNFVALFLSSLETGNELSCGAYISRKVIFVILIPNIGIHKNNIANISYYSTYMCAVVIVVYSPQRR